MRTLPLSCLPLLAALLACTGSGSPSPEPSEPPAPPSPAQGQETAAQPAPRPEAQPAAAVDIPYYSATPLQRSALEGLTLRELSLWRNTIYARVGNPFNKKWLHDYFSAQPWYEPLPRAQLERLTEVDRRNAALIAEVEASMSRKVLRERKQSLLTARMDGGLLPHEAIELELVSAALGEYAGDPSVPAEQRSPLEDPSVLDKRLTPAQISDLSRRDLRLARNTIFARHGRAFQSPILEDWFSQKTWYKVDPKYSDSRLSEVDKANIALLKAREEELGGALTDEDHDYEAEAPMGAA